MANKLFYFLVQMGENLELQREFRRDPDAVMARYGLTAKQTAAVKKAIRTNDAEDIAAEAELDGDFQIRKQYQIWQPDPKKSKK